MTWAAALRHHVEARLRDDLGLDAVDLEPDDDGDYWVCDDHVRCWVRLLPASDEEPALVRVWAPLAHGLKPSRAVLQEVNDLNAASRLVRHHHRGRTVWAATELVAQSVEPGELGRAVTAVLHAVRHAGRLLAAVHGGSWAGDEECHEEPPA